MPLLCMLLVNESPAFLRTVTDFSQQHPDLLIAGPAASGREALDKTPQLQPDVIQLDRNLPDLCEIQILPQLRTLLPMASTVVVTSHNLGTYRQAALDAGAGGFVCKGTVAADLLPTIRRVSGHR
jgi:DNA-binding NarL/FixJ family response regulator